MALHVTDKNAKTVLATDFYNKSELNYEKVLPNTVAKMKSGQTINVCIMGDSLAESVDNGWGKMLFTKNYDGNNNPHMYNLETNLGGLWTFENYALGGHTAHLQLAQLGYEREPQCKVGDYVDQDLNSVDVKCIPPILKFDLYIISMGANGGMEKELWAESIVRILHNCGKDVIVTTCNPRTDNTNFALDIQANMLKLATFYNVAIADTRKGYTDYVASGGILGDLYIDTIHQSTKGHEMYAKAMFDVIKLNFNSLRNKLKQKPSKRIFPYATNTTYTDIQPIVPRLQLPVSHNGTQVTINNYKHNPFYERYASSSIVGIKLTVGQYVKFSTDGAFSFDIVYYEDVTTNGKIQTKIQNGNTNLGNEIQLGTGTAYYRTHLAEGVQTGVFFAGGEQNTSFQLVCTQGTVVVVGVVLYENATKRVNDIRITSGVTVNKKLFNETCITSDDDTLKVEIPFYGEGIKLNFLQQRAGRKFDIFVDGTLHGNIDLYSSNQYEYYPRAYRIYGLPNGKHKIEIKMNGVNASAIAPNPTSDPILSKFILHSVGSTVKNEFSYYDHI